MQSDEEVETEQPVDRGAGRKGVDGHHEIFTAYSQCIERRHGYFRRLDDAARGRDGNLPSRKRRIYSRPFEHLGAN